VKRDIGDMGQLILLVVFLVVWIADSFVFKYSTFLTQYISNYIRVPIALIVLVISGLLAWVGLKIVFGETREEPQVITTGIFSIVRHPVYLGSILLYLGFILLSLSLLSVLVWILIIVFYYMISRYEEKLLTQRFGSVYEEYKLKENKRKGRDLYAVTIDCGYYCSYSGCCFCSSECSSYHSEFSDLEI
jgi:protein-S-isoprenylcysteine O-methyltransferase Ste14